MINNPNKKIIAEEREHDSHTLSRTQRFPGVANNLTSSSSFCGNQRIRNVISNDPLA